MNGEADNSHFGSMHVYMHLAFKELISVVTVNLYVLIIIKIKLFSLLIKIPPVLPSYRAN